MTFRGSCLCGSVQYQIDQLDGPIVHCHCTTCRKAQASQYASTGRVLRDHFRITAGEEQLQEFESSPGKLRKFCRTCGTHVFAERASDPYVILRVGTLDDDPGRSPAMHIWTCHDVAWLTDGDDVPRHAEWQPGR